MKRERATTRLSDCFIELMAYVHFMRRVCARRQPDFEEVNGRIDELIETGARRMREQAMDPRDFDDARFAVFAWVDEVILNMPWAQREQWRTAMLQVRFYNTTNGGEEFFERLNRLNPEERAVREVYFLCLSLGFSGRYHGEGDAFLLEQLRKATLKTVLGATRELSVFADEEVFPRASETALARKRAGRAKFWTRGRILLAAAPPAFLVFLFVVYSFVLNGVAENVFIRLQAGG